MSIFSRLNSEDAKKVREEIYFRRHVHRDGYKAGWNNNRRRPPYSSVVYREIWCCGYDKAQRDKYGE